VPILLKWLKRLAALAVACLGYGIFVENRSFQVRRVSVPVLPPGAPRIRVLHFSDTHLMAANKARLRFIESLAGLEPDLVVDTGDNLAAPDGVVPLGEALGRLLQVPGVYVFGSSDYEAPSFRNPLGYVGMPTTRVLGERPNHEAMPTAELEATLSQGGWLNLTGRRAILEIRGVKLEFRGTDDAHLALDDYHLVGGPASPNADVSIGITHAPYERVLSAMAKDKVRLVFAGHTHGGQVCVPLYGALTTNCDLNPKYAKGLSRQRFGKRSCYLHVSAGLGTSPFAPFRFACPPEVTLVTLTPKNPKKQHP
jgi:predicted MPP superfamily phosphohydrolase